MDFINYHNETDNYLAINKICHEVHRLFERDTHAEDSINIYPRIQISL